MECQEAASLLVFVTFQIQLHKDSLCSLGHGLFGRWPHVGPHQCGHILGWMALFIQHFFLPLPLLWRLESSQNIFLDSFAARILNVNYISPLRISYQGKMSRWKRIPSSCCEWPFPAFRKVLPGRLQSSAPGSTALWSGFCDGGHRGNIQFLCWVASFAGLRGILRMSGRQQSLQYLLELSGFSGTWPPCDCDISYHGLLFQKSKAPSWRSSLEPATKGSPFSDGASIEVSVSFANPPLRYLIASWYSFVHSSIHSFIHLFIHSSSHFLFYLTNTNTQ